MNEMDKLPCSMDGCDELTDSGLFKFGDKHGEKNKKYLIPLCTKHFHDMIIKRNTTDKKLLMIIDWKKIPDIETVI